jgi:hypothetical protein
MVHFPCASHEYLYYGDNLKILRDYIKDESVDPNPNRRRFAKREDRPTPAEPPDVQAGGKALFRLEQSANS